MSPHDVGSRERGPSNEALIAALIVLTVAAMVLAHVTHAG